MESDSSAYFLCHIETNRIVVFQQHGGYEILLLIRFDLEQYSSFIPSVTAQFNAFSTLLEIFGHQGVGEINSWDPARLSRIHMQHYFSVEIIGEPQLIAMSRKNFMYTIHITPNINS